MRIQSLPPDPPQLDIVYSVTGNESVQAYLNGSGTVIELEIAVGNGRTIWVRITPSTVRTNKINRNMWHFDGECEALDERSQPQGPEGTCNGWVSLVDNPNAVAGKITMTIPIPA